MENTVKKSFFYLKTMPKALNYTAISIFIVLLFKIFYLDNFPEPFKGLHKAGIIFEAIAGSVIASYIFYFIVIHIKEMNMKKALFPITVKLIYSLVGSCKNQLSVFSKNSPEKLTLETITQHNINITLSQLSPNEESPILLNINRFASWKEYIYMNCEDDKIRINDIISKIDYIDHNLITIVLKINDSSHFGVVGLFATPYSKMKINSMGAFAKSFFEHCMLCKELEDYLKKNYEL